MVPARANGVRRPETMTARGGMGEIWLGGVGWGREARASSLERLALSDQRPRLQHSSYALNTKYTAPIRQSPAPRKSSLIGCFLHSTANGTNTQSVITSCTS